MIVLWLRGEGGQRPSDGQRAQIGEIAELGLAGYGISMRTAVV